MPVVFRKTKKEGARIVMKGRVGIEDASELLHRLKELLDGPLTIDMANAESIDTSIVQVMLAVRNAKKDASMCVSRPPAEVVEVLEQAGLRDALGPDW